MLKNDYFKVTLISLIFSFAVLIVLPRIPLFVKNQLFKIDSYVGGYNLNLFKGKVILDLKDFKGGLDVTGGKKIVLQTKNPDQQTSSNQKELLTKFVNAVKNRLNLSGYSEYEVGIDNLQENKMYIAAPNFIDSTRIMNLVSGNGKLVIKKLINPDEWDLTKISEIVTNTSKWDSTGITNEDVTDIRLAKSSTGQNQIQLVFNIEGKKKFGEFTKVSLEKPFIINLNDSQYPVAVAVVSQNLLDNPNSDPIISGNFPVDAIKDWLIQVKNPLPAEILTSGEESVTPSLGYDFLAKYAISLGVGLVIMFGYFIAKFRKFGLISSGALLISLLVFVACIKLFSVAVSTPSIIAFILLQILLVNVTSLVVTSIKENLASGKPFDLALYQGFEENTNIIKILSVFVFILMAFVLKYSSREIKSFVLALMIGSVIILFHYFYSLKTLLELFGNNIGDKK